MADFLRRNLSSILTATAAISCFVWIASRRRYRSTNEPITTTTTRWKNPMPTVQPAVTAESVILKPADMLALEFQSLLADGDLSMIVRRLPDFKDADNSVVHLPSVANLFRLWSILRLPDDDADVRSRRKDHLKSIYDFLMASGARPTVNQIDANDGLRPIDVANQLQKTILFDDRKIVDINPTTKRSPIYDVLIRPDLFHNCRPVLEDCDPSTLDWRNADGRTALHAACSDYSRWRSECSFLLSRIGLVNPSQSCFDADPITQPPELVRLLELARRRTAVYKTVHLAYQVANAAPTLPPELIPVVVDYVL